jgi:hypothetical protein
LVKFDIDALSHSCTSCGSNTVWNHEVKKREESGLEPKKVKKEKRSHLKCCT